MRQERDLARGTRLLLFWGGPVALLVIGSGLGSWYGWTFQEFGAVFVGGTAWLGASCLVNALRCGRTHCWVDGLSLPVLAALGVLNLAGLLSIPWNTYAAVLGTLVLGSCAVECVAGPYLDRRARDPVPTAGKRST